MSPENPFTPDLSNLSNAWKEAKVHEYKPLPDGIYTVSVEKVELGMTKGETKVPMLKWTFIVMLGDHTGRYLFKNDRLVADRLPHTKTDLWKCGVDLDDINDLENHLGDLLDLTLKVRQKTNPNPNNPESPYINVYIQKRVDLEMPEANDPDALPF